MPGGIPPFGGKGGAPGGIIPGGNPPVAGGNGGIATTAVRKVKQKQTKTTHRIHQEDLQSLQGHRMRAALQTVAHWAQDAVARIQTHRVVVRH